MNKQETVADIIAEMCGGFNQSWHNIDREWAHGLADRLEAAWKREKNKIEADALFVGGFIEASRKRRYFKERTAIALQESKDAERDFDAVLGEVARHGKPQQATLPLGGKEA